MSLLKFIQGSAILLMKSLMLLYFRVSFWKLWKLNYSFNLAIDRVAATIDPANWVGRIYCSEGLCLFGGWYSRDLDLDMLLPTCQGRVSRC